MEKTTRVCLVFGILGLVFTLVGILMSSTGNSLFNYILHTQLVVTPDSGSYPMWQDLPAPIKTSMYLFNVTNANDFIAGKSKPNVVEIGPYVFDEFHTKVNLTWNLNGTVTYKQIRKFRWRPDESVGTLQDVVTILNIPAATVGSTAAKLPKATRGLLNMGLGLIGEKLFVKKKVGEILFDGYEDPLLNAAEFIHKFNVPMPGLTDKFGFYYGRNNSDWWDGIFNMYTGESDITKLGSIASWNYSEDSMFFKPPCGHSEGAGDFFPPSATGSFLQLYSNDLCRTIVLNYTSKGSVKGIFGNEFRVAPTYFGNSVLNSANWCYEDEVNGPLPSGVYNASACRFGAPIYMSQPHFYQADSFYQNLVVGLNPDEKKHETKFVVEPESGIPISVNARFQVNVLVDRLDDVDMFKKVPPRTFFPVIWFESKFELADFLVAKMWALSHIRTMMLGVGLLLLSLGLSSMIISGTYYGVQQQKYCSPQCDSQSEPILQNASLEDETED